MKMTRKIRIRPVRTISSRGMLYKSASFNVGKKCNEEGCKCVCEKLKKETKK